MPHFISVVSITRLAVVSATLASTLAGAAPITETVGRLEVNWSTLRIRFYGEAKLPEAVDPEGFRGVEKKAWQDGLNYVSDAVRNLHVSVNESFVANTERLAEEAREAAKQVATSTYSYNTTYFGDGTVRVHLENQLTKALDSTAIRFRQKEAAEPSMLQFSGVVFDVAGKMRPRATYQVVDEAGNVLFDAKDMAADAYRRHLMGRWFSRPTSAELSEAVGKAPLRIKARAGRDGSIVVETTEWEQAIGHKSLLTAGLIAIALP